MIANDGFELAYAERKFDVLLDVFAHEVRQVRRRDGLPLDLMEAGKTVQLNYEPGTPRYGGICSSLPA